MACTIKIDCHAWGTTVKGGTWSNYRIQVGSSFYWFCEEEDPSDPRKHIWDFKLEVSGDPPQNAAKIEDDDWTMIKDANCTAWYGNLEDDGTCWCVESEVISNVLWAKPSEITPWSGRLVAELFKDAGFPDDLVQIIQGDGETGAALIDARPDKICFTGSVRTGRKIGAACGELPPANGEDTEEQATPAGARGKPT